MRAPAGGLAAHLPRVSAVQPQPSPALVVRRFGKLPNEGVERLAVIFHGGHVAKHSRHPTVFIVRHFPYPAPGRPLPRRGHPEQNVREPVRRFSDYQTCVAELTRCKEIDAEPREENTMPVPRELPSSRLTCSRVGWQKEHKRVRFQCHAARPKGTRRPRKVVVRIDDEATCMRSRSDVDRNPPINDPTFPDHVVAMLSVGCLAPWRSFSIARNTVARRH